MYRQEKSIVEYPAHSIVSFPITLQAGRQALPPDRGVPETLYLSMANIGEPPNFREFFDAPREPFFDVLRAFKLTAFQVAGIGGLTNDQGLTGEIVIPFGGPAYKVDMQGNVSPVQKDDRVIFLEVANVWPEKKFREETSFATDFSRPTMWKEALACLTFNDKHKPDMPYFVKIEARELDFVRFAHPGERSQFARSIPEYVPTSVTHDYNKVENVSLVGFFGAGGAGFPDFHLHGVGTKDGKLVGGHINQFTGRGVKVTVVPLRRVVAPRSGLERGSISLS